MYRVLESYLKGTVFCGIEVISENNQEHFHVSILQKKKGTLDLIERFTLNDLDNIRGRVKKEIPIHLVINTRHVLTKQITTLEKNGLKQIKKTFSHVKVSDFFYQSSRIGNDHFQLSICRKAEILGYSERLLAMGYFPTQISFGTHDVWTLIHEEIIRPNVLWFSNGMLNLSQENMAIEDHNKINHINGLELEHTYTLGTLGCLLLYFDVKPEESSLNEITKPIEKEYRYAKLYKSSKIFSLCVIFLLLLINAIVYTNLWNDFEYLSLEKENTHVNKEEIIKLQNEVDAIENMVKTSQSSTAKASVFIGTLVKDLPLTILLDKLDYNPLESSIKSGKKVTTEHSILLTGKAHSHADFSNWVLILNRYDWVDDVEIIHFEHIDTKVSDFSLKLSLYEDK